MSFTAQDIKNFVLGTSEEDEDGAYERNGSDWSSLTWKRAVPNPNFNPEHAKESQRLYNEWTSVNRNGSQPGDDVRKAAYEAYMAYNKANETTSSPHIYVDWVYTCPKGREFPIEVLVDESGGEGHGELAYLVFKVGDDRIFRIDGSYYSYDGTTWDDDSFREVKPVVKEVTFYE